MLHSYFVSGISTNVGKTIVAGIFTQLWRADYWKPVQAGDVDNTDSDEIYRMADKVKKIHPERYKLKLPASPHEAAAEEQLSIRLSDFKLPVTENNIIVEGAGGLFVPINEQHFIIDLIQKLKLPVILVVKDYLGCINHTLLSVRALEASEITLDFVVFNGDFNPATKNIISKHLPGRTIILNIPTIKKINTTSINLVCKQLKTSFGF